jgi:hypothetical protein
VSSAATRESAPQAVSAKLAERSPEMVAPPTGSGAAQAAVIPTGKPPAILASKSVRRSVTKGEQDEFFADEVVVRHFPQKVSPPPAAAKKQADGIKRYSDLD